ncbi:MAG: hypothetical protein HY423_09000 [Candidatus Lambdaproteobacteria bacterium]|nr:hypothetical protein [Candidatus Lambdaproteobacteria bacterium]
MPITQERQTIQELRGVGFSEPQALLLAAKLESVAQATSEDLKAFMDRRFSEIDARFEHMEARFEARFERLEAHMETRFAQMDTRFAEQKADFEHSLRLHLATILSAFVAVVGLAVAIIKLFPGPGG